MSDEINGIDDLDRPVSRPEPGMTPEQVDGRLAEALRPLFQAAEAVGHFGAEANEINSFLAKDEGVRTRFQRLIGGDPAGAAEYAKLAYKDARRAAAEAEALGAAEEVREEIETARIDAGVPKGGGGRRERRNVSTTSSGEDYETKLDRLRKKAQETGDASEYVSARLHEGPNPIEIWMPGEAPPPGVMRKKYPKLAEFLD